MERRECDLMGVLVCPQRRAIVHDFILAREGEHCARDNLGLILRNDMVDRCGASTNPSRVYSIEPITPRLLLYPLEIRRPSRPKSFAMRPTASVLANGTQGIRFQHRLSCVPCSQQSLGFMQPNVHCSTEASWKSARRSGVLAGGQSIVAE